MNFFPSTVILGQLLFVLGASFCQHFWQKSIYKFYQKENKTLSAKNIFFFSSTVRAGRFLSIIYLETGPTPTVGPVSTPSGHPGMYSITDPARLYQLVCCKILQ